MAIAKIVEIMTKIKEIFIIAGDPIETFLNRGTITNPIPIIKRVRPPSTRNIRCRLKTDPLIRGMFTFRIKRKAY